MHHHTIQINHQLDAIISPVYYPDQEDKEEDVRSYWMTLRKGEEALDRTMWRARFGRGFGPVVRQTTK